MTAAGIRWPEPTLRALPRTVTAFQFETVESFITRLAHANHVESQDLRPLIGAADSRRVERLATLSGYSPLVLLARLRGLTPNDRHATRQRAHSRPACRWCSVRRGATEPVHCWFPNHVTVCHRHQRWIGPSARSWADQADLATQHGVLTAAKRHKRLCRRHRSEIVDAAMDDALRIMVRQRIFAGQPHHGMANVGGVPRWSTRRHVDAHVATYPVVVELSALIASIRPQLLHATDPSQAIAGFHAQASAAFADTNGTSVEQALHDWLYDQHLIRNAVNATARTSR
jgi:hypothetical protein